MKLLQIVLGDFVGRPANNETFLVGRAGLGNNVEVNMVDLLVS